MSMIAVMMIVTIWGIFPSLNGFLRIISGIVVLVVAAEVVEIWFNEVIIVMGCHSCIKLLCPAANWLVSACACCWHLLFIIICLKPLNNLCNNFQYIVEFKIYWLLNLDRQNTCQGPRIQIWMQRIAHVIYYVWRLEVLWKTMLT